MVIIGADFSPNHGVLCTQHGEIIYTYIAKDAMKSSLESFYQQSRNAALALPRGCPVVCDFDRNIASWGDKDSPQRNALIGTLITIIVYGFGIFARELRQADVHFVSPSAIRRCLGLPVRCKKSKVHEATMHLRPQSLRGNKFHKLAAIREDAIDAWLLAFTFECTQGV